MKHLSSCLIALTAASVTPSAQTGDFQDGELLVWTDDSSGGAATLYRIDAGTGQGVALTGGLSSAYVRPGGFEYDPFRQAILTYTAYEPLGLFSPRLLRIESDGTVFDLGFQNELLGSFAPVGDGRVYMRKNGVLYLFDANDQLTQVLDENDQPITLELEHLVYDPASDALIGVTPYFSVNPCSSFNTITFHKLPLDASGVKLSGTIDCTAFQAINAVNPLGIDHGPQGRIQVPLAGGQFQNDMAVLSLDPATMTVSTLHATAFADLNGGVWCQRISRTVVLDDVANELRTYDAGDSGSGTLLSVDVPVGDSTTGVSARNTLTDIDLYGPGCAGLGFRFGTGLAGTGGAVPVLDVASCPSIGAAVPLQVSNAVGGGIGVLVGSQGTFPYNVLGGTGYVLPPFELLLPVALGGTAGSGGQGSGTTTVVTPNDPTLIGIPFYFQAGVLDAGAPSNVSLTQALEVRLG